MIRALAIIAVICALFLAGLFAEDDASPKTDKIHIFVSILPQAYFVERIAGEYADISVLVGPGQSPATYDPPPGEIVGLSETDVYFTIGVPFETHLLDKITRMMPNLNIVDTRAGIRLRMMDPHHDADDHIHEKGAPDPHIWLDPQLVKSQARIICDECKRLAPDHSHTFENNLDCFCGELDSLDREINSLLAPHAGAHLYVFHPSYGYFADRYGLTQVAVETEGKEPGAKQLGELVHQAKIDGARAIFVQPQFATRTAEAIARELNIDVVQVDPLAREYTENLMEMARRIAASFSADTAIGSNGDEQ